MQNRKNSAVVSAMRRQMIRSVPALGLLGLASRWAIAQDAYPSRPLKVIVPSQPGGGADFVARLLADRLDKVLNQRVLVENRPGAGSLIGTDAAAKSAPDGYTLLTGGLSNIAINMGLYRNLPYDSLRDFEPIGLAVGYSYTLMTRKDLPFLSLKDLVAHAKANPGKLTYASAGIGSGQHVLAAVLWHLAGVQLLHVPYSGAQAAYQDLLGGRVDVFFDLSPTAAVQVNAGTVKALAVSGSTGNPMHPNVPTIIATGVAALELESWFGFFAPVRTPAERLERLRAALARVIAAPDVMETFRKAGGRPMSLNVAETKALVRRDVQRWTRLIREANISAE